MNRNNANRGMQQRDQDQQNLDRFNNILTATGGGGTESGGGGPSLEDCVGYTDIIAKLLNKINSIPPDSGRPGGAGNRREFLDRQAAKLREALAAAYAAWELAGCGDSIDIDTLDPVEFEHG